MVSLIPGSKPKLGLFEALKLLEKYEVPELVKLIGVRGYYQDTMGVKGKNDRSVYDDALFLVSPDCYLAFNANLDPNGYRKGHGKLGAKGIASLKEGLWRAHKIGRHKGQYTALVQTAGKVTVYRDADASVPEAEIETLDGVKVYEDTGMFGINIHKGGRNSTSSVGCQTLPPEQWESFIATAQAQLKKYKQTVMPYLLTRLPT